MLKTIKRHLHPLGHHILFWNIALFVFVKFILPSATFPLATILDQGPLFNSREVISLTNEIRADNGLPHLKPNFQLDQAASDKLNDMIRNNYFAHVSPSGTTPWFWIKQANYKYSVAGENLAIGFFSAQDTVDAWFKSSSHRANLLNSKYEDIGLAVGKGNISGHEGMVVVQMFGKSNTAAIASAQPVTTSPSAPVITPETTGQAVAAAESEPEIVDPQQISTDESVKPARKPLAIASNKGEQINNLISGTNMVYMFYSFALAVIAIMAFFLFDPNRRMGLKSLVHLNIFLFSIVISAAEVYVKASIF